MLTERSQKITTVSDKPIIAGDNDIRKWLSVEFPEGSFNTFDTIYIPENEWEYIMNDKTNINIISEVSNDNMEI